jgi:SAM-dependent methyltransferase
MKSIMAISEEELRDFYEEGYSSSGGEGTLFASWRAESAKAKADHIHTLLPESAVKEQPSLLEVGCGDGALLAELQRRRPDWAYAGVDIAQSATELASARNPAAKIQTYDGRSLPFENGEFEIGVLSHVLEHVEDPVALLAETGRVCRLVVIEIPLEANLSAQRKAKVSAAAEIGHLHHFSLEDARSLITNAGLIKHDELTDALSRKVQRFFAASAPQKLKAEIKALSRTAIHLLSPAIATRLFTVHYAALCSRPSTI